MKTPSLKLISVLCLFSVLLTSGCSWRGKKAKYGTDVPLDDFPLSSFYEPTGSDTYVFRDIHFDYDSYNIKMEDQGVLLSIVDWTKTNADAHVLVEGHCDERGSNEYNLALGEQRALAVRQFFVDHGVNAFRVQTISYGEERPVDPGHDEGAWRQNRRAHFLIAKK